MQKTCANAWCHHSFEITDEDMAFYEKVSPVFGGKKYLVPPPTQCPECRRQRRMVWRNERSLSKRKSDLTKKEIISVFPPETTFPVYERAEWFGDGWDPLRYHQEFDTTSDFFHQFSSLLRRVPRSALNGKNTENCDFCNFCFDSKDSYLSACTYYSESLLYCYWSLHCKDCTDCSYMFQSEHCHDCTDSNHSYNCQSCTLCHSCVDSSYCHDCRSCTHCFGCIGLRRKEYCLYNEQLTQLEYEEAIRKALLDPSTIEKRTTELRKKHHELYSIQEKTDNCTGDYIFESKNCKKCFQIFTSEDCEYVDDADDLRDSKDSYHCGWSQLLYETYSPVRLTSSSFCTQCWDGSDMLYSDSCQSCSSCFGCIGLKHMKYCIFNKQYTKEEYEKLVPTIIESMMQEKQWGEFFPITISPIGYNKTVAQEYFPLSKEQVLERGWNWSDYESPPPQADKLIQGKDLPTSIEDIPDDILHWAIECEATKKPFKIIKQELDFYRKMKLPIPHFHPDERHRRRMALRNPRKLWDRACANCHKPIATSYSPERPETVYCEECYLKEVY